MTTDALEAYRGMNYEIAEAIAPSWASRSEDVERIGAPVREWLVRELAPQPGQTVLELAAGAGDTGFEVAHTLGREGRLISTDFSPTMLDAARRRGEALGVENADYRVVDAERIELGDDSVDGVVCRFGYMLMADPAAALAETRRVLRPGGRVTLAVWGPPERNPFFTAVALALVQRGHMPPPDPHGPGLFSMGSEERTRTLLADAGFDEIRVAPVAVRFEVASVDDYLSFLGDTAGGIALVLRELAPAARASVRDDAAAALARFERDGGYEIPGEALCAVAS